jgi:hypothetical protein
VVGVAPFPPPRGGGVRTLHVAWHGCETLATVGVVGNSWASIGGYKRPTAECNVRELPSALPGNVGTMIEAVTFIQ